MSDNWSLAQGVIEKSTPFLLDIGFNKQALLETSSNLNTEGAVKYYILDDRRPLFGSTALFRHMNWMSNHLSTNQMNGLTLLTPRDPVFNDTLNGSELERSKNFVAKDRDSASNVTTARNKCLITVIIAERKEGKHSRWYQRFWCMVRMYTIPVSETRDPVTLCVVLPLSASVPSQLQEFSPKLDFEKLKVKLKLFLDKTYKLVFDLQQAAHINDVALNERVDDYMKDWVLKNSGDYLFDHYIPKHGGKAVSAFDKMGGWEKVLETIQDQLSSYWQFEKDLVDTFRYDDPRDVACAVSDPSAYDCPLTFVSRGFEELTGYPRDFSLARNCRFLQPNDQWRNDMLNLGERRRMRIFCEALRLKIDRRDSSEYQDNRELVQETLEGRKIINLLINENEQGFPFLNLLVMEYVTVHNGEQYIFGLQTNWMLEPRLMSEICLGDKYALQKLENLRLALRTQESKANTLKQLAKHAFTQWISDLTPQIKQPLGPRVKVAPWQSSSVPDRFPWFGVEVSNLLSEAQMIHLFHTSLQQGVRHFHFSLHLHTTLSSVGPKRRDLQKEVMVTRASLTLAIMTLLRTLAFLRDSDCFVFSMRTKPETEEVFHEIYRTLRMWNFPIRFWLLDVTRAGNEPALKPQQIINAWTRMSKIQVWGQVDHLGLYGGGKTEYDMIDKMQHEVVEGEVGRCCVHAIELYPMMQVENEFAKFMLRLRKNKVAVCAINIFGPPSMGLLKKQEIIDFAEENDMDPMLLFIKWAREMRFAVMLPLQPRTWDRTSFEYFANGVAPKRPTLSVECPPDFLERFVEAQIYIGELFDDKLPSIMRGTYQDDLRRNSSASLSIFRRRSSITFSNKSEGQAVNVAAERRGSVPVNFFSPSCTGSSRGSELQGLPQMGTSKRPSISASSQESRRQSFNSTSTTASPPSKLASVSSRRPSIGSDTTSAEPSSRPASTDGGRTSKPPSTNMGRRLSLPVAATKNNNRPIYEGRPADDAVRERITKEELTGTNSPSSPSTSSPKSKSSPRKMIPHMPAAKKVHLPVPSRGDDGGLSDVSDCEDEAHAPAQNLVRKSQSERKDMKNNNEESRDKITELKSANLKQLDDNTSDALNQKHNSISSMLSQGGLSLYDMDMEREEEYDTNFDNFNFFVSAPQRGNEQRKESTEGLWKFNQ